MSAQFHETSQFTAERYLLGELTAEERDRFEEHYFSCPACAQSVIAGATFLDNSRALLPEFQAAIQPAAARRKPRFSWFDWPFAPQIAFAALALLAVFAGYQNAVQIPHLRAQSSANQLTVTGAPVLTARRAAANFTLPASATNAPVIVPAEWDGNFPRYVVEIRNEAASQVLLASPPASATNSLVIGVPAARLGPGKYTMLIYGVSGAGTKQEVDRFPLSVQKAEAP